MSHLQIYLTCHKMQGQNNKHCTDRSHSMQRHLNTRKYSLINTNGYQYDNGGRKPRRAYGPQLWLIVVFIQHETKVAHQWHWCRKKHILLMKNNVDKIITSWFPYFFLNSGHLNCTITYFKQSIFCKCFHRSETITGVKYHDDSGMK